MTYRAPVSDIMRAVTSAAGLNTLVAQGVIDGVDEDIVNAIVDEAGRFATDQLDPLNWPGDQQGSQRRADGTVQTPDGWKEAYHAWREAGWAALPCPEEFGGQNLPTIVSMACCEIWNAANASFGAGPVLSQGAVHALSHRGSDAIKQVYMAKLVSGEWTGTMNLTEPQAGSDLGALRSRAERADDGSYRITGTKIYISYGDHDMTENIIHLVLARLPDAPAGTRGISLFLVPKVLVNDDGSLGAPNDVLCAGVEHKLGLHGSPTCTMKYGENGGAVGYLIGEENRGLQVMFLMMNAARLAVATQGVAIAERATQAAVAYANERRQGSARGSAPGEMVPIVQHPDIQRTLMTMKAQTGAARAIAMATAAAIDVSERAMDDATRAAGAARAALLTPVAKAYATDIGVEVASLGVQVHGGMGYVEETGAAQYLRDARIFPIYEGTNGIQAIDLVQRKLPLNGGETVRGYLEELGTVVADVRASNLPGFPAMADALETALGALATATDWMGRELAAGNETPVLAGATPYLRLFGVTAGGIMLAQSALEAARETAPDAEKHTMLARFFATNIASAASGLAQTTMHGGETLGEVADSLLVA